MINRLSALRTDGGEDAVPHRTVTIVGIGEGGFRELGGRAQQAIIGAQVILGTWRQLGALPDDLGGDKRPYTAVSQLPGLIEEHQAPRVVVLDQGDPSFYGCAETVMRAVGEQAVTVIPFVSSASLACARLGLPLAETSVFPLWSDDVSSLVIGIDQARPFLVLARDESSMAQVASLLQRHGQHDAVVVALTDLGGPEESISYGTAAHPPHVQSSLCVIAVITQQRGQSLLPGLSDHNYRYVHNSKHVRALSICALRPRDDDTMWSIGGGALAIEFLRSTSNSRAICFEESDAVQESMLSDAHTLGVAHRIAIQHGAPQAFDDVPDAPDVIFISGVNDDILDRAWERLREGGRLVLNGDENVRSLPKRYGGEVNKFTIDDSHGTTQQFHQWVVTKPERD